MGEGRGSVKRSPEDLEREVESIRESMDPVIQELDARRHELTDWKLQLRRHGPALMKAGAFVAGVFVAVGVVQDVQRTVRRRMIRRRLRHELAENPSDVTRDATM